MAADRHRGRILAMQFLCQWDVQRDETPEALQSFLTAQEAPRGAFRYAAQIVNAYWAQSRAIDQRIVEAARNWSLERMNCVDRNVVRVAALEIMEGFVPPGVAINEAIEIGKEYGSRESAAFINGVVDAVASAIGKEAT